MKIAKILRVTDTREYEEVGDRYVPIPGSGELNVCDRCGRTHEVHATVLLENGNTAVVGTGCMKSESAEVVSQVKSLTSATKTFYRLQAEEKDLQAKLDNNERIRAEVEKLRLPEIMITHEPNEWFEDRHIVRMGDAYIQCVNGRDLEDTKKAVTYSWKQKRQIELGLTSDKQYHLEDLQYRIYKIEKKIEKLLA